MGRHSRTTTSPASPTVTAESRTPIIVLIAALTLLALILVGLWLWMPRGGSPAPTQASGDDCTLVPVAATDPDLGRLLVSSWNDEKTDDCINVEFVESTDQAALLVAPESPVTDRLLAESGRSVAGSPDAVASTTVGLAGQSEVSPADVDPSAISYPLDEQPDASVLVAQTLNSVGPLASTGGEFTATAQDRAPEGSQFSLIDGAELVYYVHPLAPTSAISDRQAEAAASVAERATAGYSGPASSPQVSEQLWAAAGYGEGEEPAAGLAPNVLFLLDTSEAMSPYYEASGRSIGSASLGSTSAGSQVALWNYSSPLSPGVAQGWRTNLTYTDAGQDLDAAAQRFGLGGQPQTRSALVAALGNSAEQAAATGEKTRVVLVTTGTHEDLSDEQFRSALAALDLSQVSLAVVHVGPEAPDALVKEAAESFAAVPDAAGVDAAVRTATGL